MCNSLNLCYHHSFHEAWADYSPKIRNIGSSSSLSLRFRMSRYPSPIPSPDISFPALLPPWYVKSFNEVYVILLGNFSCIRNPVGGILFRGELLVEHVFQWCICIQPTNGVKHAQDFAMNNRLSRKCPRQ